MRVDVKNNLAEVVKVSVMIHTPVAELVNKFLSDTERMGVSKDYRLHIVHTTVRGIVEEICSHDEEIATMYASHMVGNPVTASEETLDEFGMAISHIVKEAFDGLVNEWFDVFPVCASTAMYELYKGVGVNYFQHVRTVMDVSDEVQRQLGVNFSKAAQFVSSVYTLQASLL